MKTKQNNNYNNKTPTMEITRIITTTITTTKIAMETKQRQQQQ